MKALHDKGPWTRQWEDEFLRGQIDCKEGKPHTDQGEAYNRGYDTQYQDEQNMAALEKYDDR